MPLAAVAAVLLAPLALAPHLLFYFDITPKVALLLLSAAIALVFASQHLDSWAAFVGTRYGRWFAGAAAAMMVLAGVAAAASPVRALAWSGSSWRRMGALNESAILFAALALAAYAAGSQARLVWVMRAICVAGWAAALYGIAQYFGWDPFLPRAGYEAGEGIYRIVRPPGTLGHSDYFAAFLLWPVFAGVWLWREDSLRGKALGIAAALAGSIAIILSGSRGAALALAAGACVLAALDRPRWRVVATAGAAAALILAGFYFSPAGERLRARVHWIGEDPAGGARPLLWRDTLRMAATRPWIGFGPDTFEAEFPRHQSEALARQYPDFHHESPHNIFLDALESEGVPGLLLLAGMIAAAIAGGFRARGYAPLLAAFLASVVAHQFIVFTAMTAFSFFLGAALLAGAGARVSSTFSPPLKLRRVVLAAGAAAAALLCAAAYRFTAADASLATVQRRLDANDPRGAAEAYRKAVALNGPDVTANIYFSRRWTSVTAQTHDTASRLYYGQIAAGAASLATKSPEQPQNAWYNLAALGALTNDARTVEFALRSAISAEPVWYKPHWSLARLLAAEGRHGEAEEEARAAIYLDGGKDPEVASTLSQIAGSARSGP